ncbi:MAG TPA: cytidylate kinase-like family protein [Streptosporangiaceae bacterium]|nr:cytidylate kinase-like family protein [Streptosporangiaceae bacterium]
MSASIVTISATFGAGGSVVGPEVAERLGLPFIDRAIPVAVAAEIGCTLDEALAHDDRAERGIGRILAGAARLPNVALGGMDVYLPDHGLLPEEEFVARTEKVLEKVTEGVVLGRAGAIVLADRPHCLHVRIDGGKERRLAKVARSFGLGPREAERMLNDNDRARAAYVKHFYRVDPADPGLYHLVLDGARLPESVCADLIVAAAQAM